MSNKNKKNKFSWIDVIKSILFLVGDRKPKYIFLTIAMFSVTQIFSFSIPFLIGKIIDILTISDKEISLFYIYTILISLISATCLFTRLTIKKYIRNIRDDIVYETKVRGFEKISNLDLETHNQKSPGAMAQKIEAGTSSFITLSRIIDNDIFFLITSLVNIILIFSFLNLKYIIFFLIYITTFWILLKFFDYRLQNISYELNKSLEKLMGSYVEGLSNILTIKASSAENSFQDHIASKEETRKKNSYEFRKVGINQWRSIQVLNGIMLGSFIFMTGQDVMHKTITVGSFVIFHGYFEKIRFSLVKLLEAYGTLIESKTAIARMMPIFSSKEINNYGNKKFPNWDKIKIHKANFKYRKTKINESIPAIRNVNLEIKKFQKIGIVGKTGSGKSTLAKILVGLYALDSGEYRIGNLSFYDISKQEIGRNIAIVLQESEIFNMSLKDNITLLKKFNEKRFQDAIEISKLEEIINKLPQGANTLLGERGYHLSGGERQRIGIARAIYANPDIIIFDEASSSLDNRTEKLIQANIEKNLDTKTLIFIAHRFSTLENMDLIYVFRNGEIIEQGKFNDLLARQDSEFSKLYHKKTS